MAYLQRPRPNAKPHEPWGKAEPLIKAHDLAYVRFSCPDLETMHTFINEFGLKVVHYEKNKCIYSRGLEKDYPYAHIVHQGPPKFIGFAFRVNKLEDLHTLANNVPNCTPVEEMTGIEGKLSNNPGIAKKVSFIDPVNGFLIEAVYGQKCDEIPSRHAQRILYNYGERKNFQRLGRLQDVGNRKTGGGEIGMVECRKLGHCVLSIHPSKFKDSLIFFHDTFGLIGSDTNFGDKEKTRPMSQFMHLDRGEEYTDHHTIFLLPGRSNKMKTAQLSHLSFEMETIDDVFRGHHIFRNAKKKNRRRYQHAWGLGRHVQGSQVYDYWFDPWGHIHEHMCDGDQINNTHEHRMWGPGDQTGAGDQWGPTEEESTVFNLFGPDRCEYFPLLPTSFQESILSRDLEHLIHIDVVDTVLKSYGVNSSKM